MVGGENIHVRSSSSKRANSGRSKKFEDKASFDENYIRNLRSQVDTSDWDLRRTLEGMEASQA